MRDVLQQGAGKWRWVMDQMLFSATLHRAVKEQGWQVEKRRSDARTFEYRLVKQSLPQIR